MKELLRSRNLWIMVLMFGGYWAIAPHLPRQVVFDLANGLSAAVCVGVMIMLLPSVLPQVWRNDLSGAYYLVLGVCGVMGAVGCRHAYNWVWRHWGEPAGWQDTLFVGFLVWSVFVMGVLVLMARDIEEGKVPKENWRWLGLVVAVGIVAATVAISYLHPSPPVASEQVQ